MIVRALVLAGFAFACSDIVHAADIVSHRATYTLTFGGAQPSAGFTGATGTMEVELVAACDGFRSKQAMQLAMLTAGGPATTTQFTGTIFERMDAAQMTFETTQSVGGQVEQSFKGTAVHPIGQSGSIRYDTPKGLIVPTPRDTLFPIEGSRRVLDAAAAGEAFLAANLFDGGGPDALSAVSVLISTAEVGKGNFGGRSSWRVQIAHYPMNSAAATPEFEEAYRLYAGGILDELDLNYGLFRLKGALSKLELLPAPTC